MSERSAPASGSSKWHGSSWEEEEGGLQVRYRNGNRRDLRRSNLYVEISPDVSARALDKMIEAAKHSD